MYTADLQTTSPPRVAQPTARTMATRRRWLALVALCGALVLTTPSSLIGQGGGGSVTGDLRFHTPTSEVFGNTRQLRVWVPPGYDDPALYLNDAQNLFDSTTSFVPTEWKVNETRQPPLPTWLSGCWVMEIGNRVTEEHWMAPRGGAMLGMSRTTMDNTLRQYEFLLLRHTDGALVYEANPSGQAPASFAAIESSETSLVFENPDHDFPQRIGYQAVGADSLLAWNEGTVRGQARRGEFRYERRSCADVGN